MADKDYVPKQYPKRQKPPVVLFDDGREEVSATATPTELNSPEAYYLKYFAGEDPAPAVEPAPTKAPAKP